MSWNIYAIVYQFVANVSIGLKHFVLMLIDLVYIIHLKLKIFLFAQDLMLTIICQQGFLRNPQRFLRVSSDG